MEKKSTNPFVAISLSEEVELQPFGDDVQTNESPLDKTIDLPMIDGVNDNVNDYIYKRYYMGTEDFEDGIEFNQVDNDFQVLYTKTYSSRYNDKAHWHSTAKFEIERNKKIKADKMKAKQMKDPSLCIKKYVDKCNCYACRASRVAPLVKINEVECCINDKPEYKVTEMRNKYNIVHYFISNLKKEDSRS